MLETGFGLPELMQELGQRGITMILKVDGERSGFGQGPWTVVLSGAGLGEGNSFHADFKSFREALDFIIESLKGLPGDWTWLEKYPVS